MLHSHTFVGRVQPASTAAVHDVEPQIGEVTQRPEVVDDFIRNFLVKMGLTKTLEMFETEWWVLQGSITLHSTNSALAISPLCCTSLSSSTLSEHASSSTHSSVHKL